MRIEQEKIPSAETFFNNRSDHDDKVVFSGGEIEDTSIIYLLEEYLNLHKKAIRYEYDQYQFFLDGYRNGSASISEVREAHDRFLKLLDT